MTSRPPVASPTFGLAFTRDGQALVATQSAGTLQAWDPVRGTFLFRIGGDAANGRGWVATGPGSEVLATLDGKRAIVLRNPSTGAEIRTLDSSEGSRIGVFSPDGRFLVAGSDQAGAIRVWEVATGRARRDPRWPHPARRLPGLQPGRREAGVRQLRRHREDLGLPGSEGRCRSIEVTPAGSPASPFIPMGRASPPRVSMPRVPARSACGTPTRPRTRRSSEGTPPSCAGCSFLPDGQRLVTLGDDGVLKLWDAASGQETLSITAHLRNGLGLAVSPDGRRLATSGGGSVRIWDSGFKWPPLVLVRLRSQPYRLPRSSCAGPPRRRSCASRARACCSVAVSSRPRDRAIWPMVHPGSLDQKTPRSSDSE